MRIQTVRDPVQRDPSVIEWKIIIRFLAVVVLLPAVLLIAAGRADWWQGWAYVALSISLSLVSRYLVWKKHPDLIEERAHYASVEGVKGWDRHLVIWIAVILPLAFMVTAGLDQRFAWSARVAPQVQVVAIVVFLAGYAVGTWAMVVNEFFSAVVRIQTERSQHVVTTGPYRFVRHPGYVGGIVVWVASPILLGSAWSWLPAGAVIVLLVVRTASEDRTLRSELAGYAEYALRTRYRLVPGIW